MDRNLQPVEGMGRDGDFFFGWDPFFWERNMRFVFVNNDIGIQKLFVSKDVFENKVYIYIYMISRHH